MLLKSSNYDAGLDRSILKARDNFYCIDNYTTHVKFNIDEKNSIIFTNYEILKKYENILIEHSVWTELKEEHKYRPEYLSKMLYDNIHLWYLILFLNKMDNAYQLDKKYVRILHPDNIYILNEIYTNEKDYIKHVSADPNGLTMKSLYAKSDSILKKPDYSILDKIGSMDPSLPSDSEGNEGFFPLQYNLGRAYLTQPISCERPNGLTYGNGYIEGTIISKKNEIVSLKPMYMGNSCRVLLNGEEILKCPDNTKEIINLNNRDLKPLSKVVYTKYELIETIDWYNAFTNSLLVRLKCNFSQMTDKMEKKIKITFFYEAGTKSEVRSIYLTNPDMQEVRFVFDISPNYGKLQSISIALLGDFREVRDDFSAGVAFMPYEFKYTNVLLSKDDYYHLKIEHTNSAETVYPMISYSFKDYKQITKEDLVTKNIVNNLNLVPTTPSPTNLIINNTEVFKGLQLISLIDNNELANTDINGNHLEDSNQLDLKDMNDRLLLYKSYDTKNTKIDDYYISTNLFCRNDIPKINGSMGLFIKGKVALGEDSNGKVITKSYCYLYMLKMNNEYTDKTKSLLSGLYKLDPEADNIDLDSDGLNFKNLIKIADTKQTITGNRDVPTFVKIITRGNNIKIYDDKSALPLIDYYDANEIKFDLDEQPSFGLALFNVRNPGYKNLIVMGKQR